MAGQDRSVFPHLDRLMSSCIIEGVELKERIGSGSYAEVYRGTWKGIPVAVKQLHGVFFEPSVAENHQVAMRTTFEKELSMNMRLRHPNIIQFLGVYCAPEDDQRRAPMMVMELMDTTLDCRLAELRKEGAKMNLHEVVDIAADVAAALVYLHEQVPNPIAHRDLAPKNILLSASGRAKLADLGVAKAFSDPVRHTLTPGTPAFMPPEVQLTINYAPPPVDIYSFGVSLLEMCSGTDAIPSEFMRQNIHSPMQFTIVPEKERRATSFDALGKDHLLEELIIRCLESSPENRPRARELHKNLSQLKACKAYKLSVAAKSRCKACESVEQALLAQLAEKELQMQKLQEEVENFRQCQKQRLASLQRGLNDFRLGATEPAAPWNGKSTAVGNESKGTAGTNSSKQEIRGRERKHPQQSVSFRLERRPVDIVPRRRRSWTEPLDPDSTSESDNEAGVNQPLPPRSSTRHIRKSNTALTLDELKTYKNISYGDISSMQPTAASFRQSPAGPAGATSMELVDADVPSDYLLPVYPTAAADEGKTMWQAPVKQGRRVGDQSLYTTGEGEVHLYSEIPAPMLPPPPPPPRSPPFSTRRTRSWHTKTKAAVSSVRNGLPAVTEGKETAATCTPAPASVREWDRRKVQSMKGRIQSPTDGRRPSFTRQGSSGDALISRVTKTYRSRKPRELSVTKGELVKVTNSAMDKEWSVAVPTTGKGGSVKKKYLERVEPAIVDYDERRPVRTRQSGIITHIAVCGHRHNVWASPIETHKITITPSSLHSGEVNMLVKMTDYVMCCTDDEPHSSFEIDLHRERLAKLSGYLLQCHFHGNNGYPRHWKLEGSHNGQSWTPLSEVEGDFFLEGNYACYFEVTNPTPCRYFRLVQMGANSAENDRLCLSGLELFGNLYSSFPEEMFT